MLAANVDNQGLVAFAGHTTAIVASAAIELEALGIRKGMEGRHTRSPRPGRLGFGSPTRARTWDLRINSPSLYRLSYRGIGPDGAG